MLLIACVAGAVEFVAEVDSSMVSSGSAVAVVGIVLLASSRSPTCAATFLAAKSQTNHSFVCIIFLPLDLSLKTSRGPSLYYPCVHPRMP